MTVEIGHVCRVGVPTKVLKPVILTVAVVVAALHSRGARADKGKENQMVNLHRSSSETQNKPSIR